jgi:hypothetical protein
LATVRTQNVCHTISALHKGHIHKVPGSCVARGAPGGRTLQKKWTQLECNVGIRDGSRKQPFYVGNRKTLYEEVGQIVELEVKKQVAELSTGLWEVNNSTFWKIQLSLKRKNDITTSITAGGMSTPVNLGSSHATGEKGKNWLLVHCMSLHLSREPFGTNGLKEGAEGAVGV